MNAQWEALYNVVKENKPSEEKILEYTFLPPEKLRIEDNGKQEVMVVAEDCWSETYGMSLVLTQDGRVYVAEMPSYEICGYCANSYAQFVAIAEKYRLAADKLEACEEQERILRNSIEAIDETALEDENYFWSAIAEEIGYGII